MKFNKVLIAGRNAPDAASVLVRQGYIVTAIPAGDISAKLLEFQPDLIITELNGSVGNSIKNIRTDHPETEVIAVLSQGEEGLKGETLAAGAFSAVSEPLDPGVLTEETKRALERRSLLATCGEMQKERDIWSENLLRNARVISNVVEMFDPVMGGHLKRVAKLARVIGVKLELPKMELADIETAGLLHDIGKIALPKRLQNTPFPELEGYEVEVIRRHTVFAQSLLSISKEYSRAATIIRSHLEHIDGSGYPDQLKGESIPLGARILAVANAYDELKQRRLFTLEAFGSEKEMESFAFDFLKRSVGTTYDGNIIETLKKAIAVVANKSSRTEVTTIERLVEGTILSSDLKTKEGDLLLSRGIMLSPRQLMRIKMYYDLGYLNRDISVVLEKLIRFQ